MCDSKQINKLVFPKKIEVTVQLTSTFNIRKKSWDFNSTLPCNIQMKRKEYLNYEKHFTVFFTSKIYYSK